MSENVMSKDTASTLDFVFDWSSWLASGETISSFTVTATTGITLGTASKAPSQAAGKVTYWLSGGTAGVTYPIQCTIVTSAGRTDNRKMIIRVVDR
jgi:hypothetical protein